MHFVREKFSAAGNDVKCGQGIAYTNKYTTFVLCSRLQKNFHQFNFGATMKDDTKEIEYDFADQPLQTRQHR